MKWAVMVPFDNDYIYVTRPSEVTYELETMLLDTREDAIEAAKIWGKLARVVEYEEDHNDT